MDPILGTDPSALRLAGSLVLLTRAIDEQLRRAAPQDELGVLDLSVMEQLAQGETLPSGVARILHLQRGSVTRMIDRLVRSGYVERERSRADRRQCHLHLTSRGRERLARGLSDLSSLVHALLHELPGDLGAGLRSGLAGAGRMLSERAPARDESDFRLTG